MKKYIAWAKIAFKERLFARGVIFEAFLNSIISFIIMYFLWKGIYGDADIIKGRTLQDMVTYLAISIFINSLFSYPNINFMINDICYGDIQTTIIRPINYQFQFFAKDVGTVTTSIVTGLVGIIFLNIIITPINAPVNIFLFIISLILAFFARISFNFLLGTLAFKTENGDGIILFSKILVNFASGMLIPLNYFPKAWENILIKYLPFSSMLYTPIKIYEGKLMFVEMLTSFAIQILWIGIFIIIGHLLYKKFIKKVYIYGG